jgi:uncharacterized membrane protein YgcG
MTQPHTRDEAALDDTEWIEDDELPPRPRRRWLTPLTGTLLGILLLACGFVAGALVEKGQGSSSPAAAAGGFRRAGAAAAAFGQSPRGAGGNATIGRVSSLQGRTLYVTTTDGNTVQVNVPAGEQLSRTTAAGVRDIHPGDTVVIQGSAANDGTITASAVRATSADAPTGGFGGGFGRGGGGGAGGSGGNGSVNQLFQPSGG